MAQINRNTEPRPSFLVAVIFTGLAIQLMAGKGWIDDWGGGQVLWVLAAGWLIARNWYLGGGEKNIGIPVVDREIEQD